MKVLAIDTTETTASAALTDDKALLGIFTLEAANSHSVTLLPMIDALMRASNTQLSDIELFAFAEGPGSFTGLRIGAATLKGLAFDCGKRCVGVSSLLSLAENMADFDGVVCAVINARRGQFYTYVCRFRGGQREELIPDCIMMRDDIVSAVVKYGEDIYFVGSGAEELGKLVPRARRAPEILVRESAYSVAVTAYEKYMAMSEDERADCTAARLNPVYLRKPQAERELEEKNARLRQSADSSAGREI